MYANAENLWLFFVNQRNNIQNVAVLMLFQQRLLFPDKIYVWERER